MLRLEDLEVLLFAVGLSPVGGPKTFNAPTVLGVCGGPLIFHKC